MILISDMKEGMHIRGIYYVTRQNTYLTKAGKEYIRVALQDKTGLIDGFIWDLGASGIEMFEQNEFVSIEAIVNNYNGNYQLIISRIRPAEVGEYEVSNYAIYDKEKLNELYFNTVEKADEIENEYLRQLVVDCWLDEETKYIIEQQDSIHFEHSNVVGKLLERINKQFDATMRFFVRCRFVNRDLVLASLMIDGALQINTSMDHSNQEDILRTAWNMIIDKTSRINNFSDDLANELINCISMLHINQISLAMNTESHY